MVGGRGRGGGTVVWGGVGMGVGGSSFLKEGLGDTMICVRYSPRRCGPESNYRIGLGLRLEKLPARPPPCLHGDPGAPGELPTHHPGPGRPGTNYVHHDFVNVAPHMTHMTKPKALQPLSPKPGTVHPWGKP